jgi:hypothetical protein
MLTNEYTLRCQTKSGQVKSIFSACGVYISYRGEDILTQRNDSLVVEFQSSASRCRRYYFGHGCLLRSPAIILSAHLPASCHIRPLHALHHISLVRLVGLTCLRVASTFVVVFIVKFRTIGAYLIAVHATEEESSHVCSASLSLCVCV